MSGTIKLILLFIFLSIPLALANQSGENANDSVLNFSVLVNDIRGDPVNYAHIEAVSSLGSSIFGDTESNGKAYIQITDISNLRVKAAGYRDWVYKEKISSNMLILTLENESANTYFHITDTRQNNVPDAFIIVIDSAGNQIVNITDANGVASIQVSPGEANISIKADRYFEFNTISEITPNNVTYSYVIREKNSWKILIDLIALIIPIILMLWISISNWPEKMKNIQYNSYIPGFGWIISFSLLISTSYLAQDYNIYFLDSSLKTSLFVPIAAFIGVMFHISKSILDTINRRTEDLDWKKRFFDYGRRLFVAPYIAAIAVYTILPTDQLDKLWIVVSFALFVGFNTKQFEGIFQELGNKFLTEKQKIDLNERDLKALELVQRLGISTTIAEKLDKLGISEIYDLKTIPDNKIHDIALKVDIDQTHLKILMAKAQKHAEEIETMGTDLNIYQDTLRKLVYFGVYSKNQLAAIPNNKKMVIVDNGGIDEGYLNGLIEKAKTP